MAEPRAGHADHDPLLIVASLDDDLPAAERAAIETLLATCPDCAALRADLISLATATGDLPTPARARDFRLTAADAARLAPTTRGEPTGATARLAGVMTDGTTLTSHAGHDPMLVASLADHSLATTERAAAEALVASCDECAALHADVLALREATRAMPTPPRPRDYALTPADAVRLRRGGWRRFVAAFGSSRDVFSKPLAAGLTTLGLAGLLLASAPAILPSFGSGATSLSTLGNAVGLGAPAAAPGSGTDRVQVPAPSSVGGFVPLAPQATGAAAAAASTPPKSDSVAAPGGPKAGPSAAPPRADGQGSEGVAAGPGASAPAQDSGSPTFGASSPSGDQPGLPLLAVVSGAFLIVGLSLFAIRWTARRLGDG